MAGRFRLVALVMHMLAVVAPMATELAGVRRAIGDPHGSGMMLRVVGVGRQHTEAGIAAVAAESPTAIALIGFCGATDPDLLTGDLHVAEVFHSIDRPGPIPADPTLAGRIRSWADRSATRFVGGPSATVTAIAGVKTKSILRAETGSLSVNMEDYWAARVAAAHGIPFASVRAVLDTAGDELPGYLSEMGNGIINVLRGMATHPGSVPGLIRLAHKAQIARARLADCVSGALDGLPTPSAGAAGLAQ